MKRAEKIMFDAFKDAQDETKYACELLLQFLPCPELPCPEPAYVYVPIEVWREAHGYLRRKLNIS